MVMQLMTLTTALILSTVSWFGSVDYFTPENAKSGVIAGYFHPGGTGTRENPYVITKPLHYYNLIYLQENGYNFTSNTYFQFGKYGLNTSKPTEYCFYKCDTETGVVDETQFSNYLDLNYYQGDKALQPLGSATHPFVSKVLGRNLTVRNLHIKGEGFNDIGVFGYVSSTAKINNLYFNGVDIDTAGAVQRVVEDQDHTTHENPHIGYLAGHIADEDTFDNVYIDNCVIRNSDTNTYEMGSAYGFFGECENVEIPQHGGESYHYSLNASSVYDYLDDKHTNSGLATQSLALRDTENNTTTSAVSSAITESGTGNDKHYSFVGDHNGTDATRNYSLGTTGSKELEKTYDLYHQNGSRTFPDTTEPTDIEPDAQTEEGDYVYYDSTYKYSQNSKWIFYSANPISGESSEKYFNVFLISYVNPTDGVTYLKTDGSNLSYQSGVSPNFTDMTNGEYDWGDYFFVFKASQASAGVKKITDYSFGTYKIFSPKYNKYLVGPTANIQQPGTTTLDSTYSNGTDFTVSGRTGEITYLVNSSGTITKCGFASAQSTHHLTTKKINGATPSLLLTIHGGSTSSQKYDGAYQFKRATSLSDITNGSKVTLLGYDTTSDELCYYAIGSQAQNNRLVSAKVEISEQFTFISSDIANLHMFEVGKDGSTLTFKDVTEGETSTLNYYLYAASSGSNHLKSQETNDANGQFTASISDSTTYQFSLIAQGSNSRNRLMYNYSSNLFACYNGKDSGRDDPYIYIVQGKTIGYKYTETATPVKYVADGGSNLETLISSLYYTEQGASFNDANSRPLNAASIDDGDWLFGNLSKVTITPEIKDGWFLVNGTDELQAGEKYVFAYNVGGKTAGAYSNSVLANLSSTFSNDKSTISSLNASTVIYELQGSPGSWKFKEDNSNYYLNNQIVNNVSGFSQTADSASASTWTITIDSGNATVYNTISSSMYAIYYNTTNTNFRTYEVATSETKDIQLYRLYSSDAVATYFADEIKTNYDQYYDYQHIDLMGGADIYSTYISLDKGALSDANTKMAAIGTNDIGQAFVKTVRTSDCILLFVPNTGSLDYGTLTIDIIDSVAPVFIKGGGNSVTLADVGCSAEENSSTRYKLSLNTYNIKNLSYCALDSSKNILSAYNSSGVKTYPVTDVSDSSVYEYVLALGCPAGNDTGVKIANIDLIFNEVVGNVGNFGTVGFRTAVYSGGGVADSSHNDDAAGNNLTTTNNKSVVPGQVINFQYTVPAGKNFAIKTTYDSTTNSYYITILCDASEGVTVYIFNYDAERAKVYVRDRESGIYTPKKESYNVFNVTQSTAPSGGWYSSYTAITDD